MAIKVGINGFGRIGRNVLRAAVQNFGDDIEVVVLGVDAEKKRISLTMKPPKRD